MMTGEITSKHHQVFHSGSKKERKELKYGNNYGPIRNGIRNGQLQWSLSERLNLHIMDKLYFIIQITILIKEEITPVANE